MKKYCHAVRSDQTDQENSFVEQWRESGTKKSEETMIWQEFRKYSCLWPLVAWHTASLMIPSEKFLDANPAFLHFT